MQVEGTWTRITDKASGVYEHFGVRPEMYGCPIGSAEAFVFGVEAVLDSWAVGETRVDRYVDFPGSDGFGAESFTARFERRHCCRLRFAPQKPPFDAEMSAVCEDRFRKRIVWHFREYLKWRRKIPPNGRSVCFEAVYEMVYEAAIIRPETFGGRFLGGENFMIGVDLGVDCFGTPPEPQFAYGSFSPSYWDFLRQRGFDTTCGYGPNGFTGRYLQRIGLPGTPICIAFVPLDRKYDQEASRELEAQFKLEFADHWQKFLEWRRSRQPV